VRIVIAAGAALLLSVALLQDSGRSGGAVAAAQPSVHVAVIPGFAPKPYPGTYGVPPLPVSDPSLSAYHFAELPADQVTAGALAGYDTVLLYGIRWSDLSAGAQQAIDAFARTGKVLIWDADDTGAQSYSTFIHPFSTAASGENGKANDSVVSFPNGGNFLASPDPSNPAYLDPNQLITDRNMINDMNAMTTGTPGWEPALVAQNKSIPQGGWPLAWSYGVVGDHTGLEIYSGIDADAFADNLSPNYAVKELALQLAAPFLRAPESSCAPSCQPPTSSPGKPYAACAFARPLPKGWVRRRVPIVLKTSVVPGISGTVSTRAGRVLSSARERKAGLLELIVPTTRLRSNRAAPLRANVLVDGQRACSLGFRLRVDNLPPRPLLLATVRRAGHDLLRLRLSERSTVTVYYGPTGRATRTRTVGARRLVVFRLPGTIASATVIARDRAGNRMLRRVHWR